MLVVNLHVLFVSQMHGIIVIELWLLGLTAGDGERTCLLIYQK